MAVVETRGGRTRTVEGEDEDEDEGEGGENGGVVNGDKRCWRCSLEIHPKDQVHDKMLTRMPSSIKTLYSCVNPIHPWTVGGRPRNLMRPGFPFQIRKAARLPTEVKAIVRALWVSGRLFLIIPEPLSPEAALVRMINIRRIIEEDLAFQTHPKVLFLLLKLRF